MIVKSRCKSLPGRRKPATAASIGACSFAISPRTGVYALAFLIVIHKLEYFLNSKIVGKRINSPIWLTLIGLVVGERLMGISGMILAPTILHYIRVEASAFRSMPAADLELETQSMI